MIYKLLGPPLLRFAVAFVRRRYRSQIRIAVGVGVVSLGVAAYLASRNVPEG
jgi:hypothetical protein